MVTDTDYAWAAGFIEADGCIHLSQSGNTKAEVIVVQKDRRPIDRLQAIFEDHGKVGKVTRRNRTAVYYRITFSGQRAANVLRLILPYLEHKREIALLAIQLYGQIRAWVDTGIRKVPQEELAKRLDLVRQARTLSGDAERLSGEALVQQ